MSIAGNRLVESGLFQSWKDPVSGVESFLLETRVAPFRQSFYFVNPGMSADGRFCWFYCAFPPAGSAGLGRSLAVADLVNGTVHHFPETMFSDASPMVDPLSGEVYWCSGLEVWKRSPFPDTKPSLAGRFPEKLARNRGPQKLATHLTFSADRRALNLDAAFYSEWFIGHIPLDGGEFVLWEKFDRAMDHAQFSPVDPDVQLIAEDFWVEPRTGEIRYIRNRMWLIRRGGLAMPIFPEPQASVVPNVRGPNPHLVNDTASVVTDERSMHGHEWWSADGRHVCFVHYHRGVFRVDVSSLPPLPPGSPLPPFPAPERLWASDTVSHAHMSADGRWLVADCVPGAHTGIWHVVFVNLETGREAEIVSHSEYPPESLRRYHVHPHPQFCAQDRYVCYTTFVRGQVDVALCDVEQLVALTS
ncbi:MAG: oligogalacturonate lyase family protein [Opitutaceae bacterium]|nr:oligogalacturonate lyase family protein [Opitutaceae bacterium]